MATSPWVGIKWGALGLLALLIGTVWLLAAAPSFNLWLFADRYVAAELEVKRFQPTPGRGGQGRFIEGVIQPGGERVVTSDSYISIRRFVDPNDTTGRRVPLREEIRRAAPGCLVLAAARRRGTLVASANGRDARSDPEGWGDHLQRASRWGFRRRRAVLRPTRLPVSKSIAPIRATLEDERVAAQTLREYFNSMNRTRPCAFSRDLSLVPKLRLGTQMLGETPFRRNQPKSS